MSPAELAIFVAAIFLILGAAIAAWVTAEQPSRERGPEPCLPCEGYAGDCTCEWHCGSLACDPKKGVLR